MSRLTPSTTPKIDRLIDQFVERVNSSRREPLCPEDVPARLRVGPPDELGCFDWQIQRAHDIDWIAPFDAQLPASLPPSFRSLVTRYVYPELEIGDLCLLANTGENIMHEWRTVVDVGNVEDRLTQMLMAHGYIQFARPIESVNYDAICFDIKQKSGRGECPLVWIDHEAILCYDKIRVVRKIVPSLVEIIEGYGDDGTGPSA